MSKAPSTGPLDRPEAPNNFGAIRLVLALLVILSHSPEMVDGNRSREILTRIFGTISLGELSVDSFFIISGFLITKSFLQSSSAVDYMLKRVLRIYPGYVVAFLLCAFVLAPRVGGAAGAYQGLLTWDSIFVNILLLNTPEVPGAFSGQHYPSLNGSAWTIRYEFLAYLVVLGLGLLGLLQKRRVVLFCTVLLLVANLLVVVGIRAGMPASWQAHYWPFSSEIRFLGMFGSGALFHLYRDRIVYAGRYAAVALCALCALLLSSRLASIGVATMGGYLLFYAAGAARWPWLSRIGRRNDLSYGVYLYAWPIAATILWFDPNVGPWMLFFKSAVLAAGFALVSWVAIERPAMQLKKKRFSSKPTISSTRQP